MSEQVMQNKTGGVMAWFIHNPVAANLLMLLILFTGIGTALNLRVEGFPSVDPTNINIDVQFESGDAKQAEQGIAIKIERALQGTKGIRNITSTSTTQGVSLHIESQNDYDLDKLNTEVKNIIDGLGGLPEMAEKPVIYQQQWQEAALWISIYGDVNQHQLQQAASQFEDALLALPSINQVNKKGWQTPELAIEINEQQLQAYHLTLADVVEVIRAESVVSTSGELRSENGTILLKADNQRYYPQEFGDIIVKQHADGSVLSLGEIATVYDSFVESPNVLSRFQGKPAITLEVIVGRDANIIELAEQARGLVTAWRQQGRLAANMDIKLWNDQSISMVERLFLVLKNGAIGIVLVMLVLTIFLHWKVALWVGMGLPVCFAGGLLMMGSGFFDLTLNQLTTFGFVLVLGILVDDAVVVGESVYTEQQKGGDALTNTINGVNRVAVPTAFGVLTTVAAFYPLSFIEGRLGSLFAQFALVCTACLLFSLIESRFILPAHLRNLSLYKPTSPIKTPTTENAFKRGLTTVQQYATGLIDKLNQRVYSPVISLALHYRYVVLSLFITIFILVTGMVASDKVKLQFFPDIPEETVSLFFSAEQGAGFGVVHHQVSVIEQLATELNQKWRLAGDSNDDVIQNLYAIVDNDIAGVVTITLNDKSERRLTSTDVAEHFEQQLETVAGLREIVITLEDHDEKDLMLTLLSTQDAELTVASKQVYDVLAKIDGIEDLDSNLVQGQSQLTFELTPAGRALGLTTATLAEQIQYSFYGAQVQRLQRGKEEIRVRVRYPKAMRADITQLKQARIRTPSGQVVSLSTVAAIKRESVVDQINRQNGYRAATISANVDHSKTSVDDVYQVLQAEVLDSLQQQMPQLQIKEDGDAAEEDESAGSLMSVLVFSLFAIYFLVAIPLKSYWQPLVIMSAIPFGFVGAIIGHWYMDIAISILSINGMLALSGVVVNDSLLLVNQFNQLREQGMERHQALVSAGKLRMRAILLTSITTVLGLLSLLGETSEQGQFLVPAATSLAFGITFATVISLILIPVVILISHDIKQLIIKLLSFFGLKRDEENPLCI